MMDEFHTLQKLDPTLISTAEFKVVVAQSSTATEEERKSKSQKLRARARAQENLIEK